MQISYCIQSLYTKSGFALREPLFLMRGQPLQSGNNARSANVCLVRDDSDISVCNELCKSVHGFSWELELRQAKDQGVATMIERDSYCRLHSRCRHI